MSPRRPVAIDAHVHLWRLARGDNLALPPSMAPIYRDREPQDLRPLLDAAGIERIIVVQAAWTLAETLFTHRPLGRAFPGSPASSAGSIRCRRRSKRRSPRSPLTGRLQGHPPGQRRTTTDSIAWMLDARFERCWSLIRERRTGARIPRAEPGRSAARHAVRAGAIPTVDRARPLRQARHRRRPLRAVGERHRRAGGLRRTSPASSPASSTARRRGAGAAELQALCRSRARRFRYATGCYGRATGRRSSSPPTTGRWRTVSLELLDGLTNRQREVVLGANAERIYALQAAGRRTD